VSSAAPARAVGSGRRFTWKRTQQLVGVLYVLPTFVYVMMTTNFGGRDR